MVIVHQIKSWNVRLLLSLTLVILTLSANAQVSNTDTVSIKYPDGSTAVTSASNRRQRPAPTESTLPEVDSLDTSLENVLTKDNAMTRKPKRDWTKWRPDPKRALWLAIVIPGGGQIYNRKYWKLPIFYGGFVGCIYAMTWNNQMYHDYSQAYMDLMDSNPETNSYTNFIHSNVTINASNEERYKELFRKRKNRYRRWRDLATFVTIAVYAVSVIDAYVDASLSDFDISDDLSLHLAPKVMNESTTLYKTNTQAIGLGASLRF